MGFSTSSYSSLSAQTFELDEFEICPIRYEDRIPIMKWRNEQIFHLRQNKPLTEKDQNQYFNTVVKSAFQQENPNQILFSFFENNHLIGYGGLVHIDWSNRNAEISCLLNTEFKNEAFALRWKTFLKLIQQVAFGQLTFEKVFTYAYDLRPEIYEIVESEGFRLQAKLKRHIKIEDEFVDCLIHSKHNLSIEFRKAKESDVEITYKWLSDKKVRAFSFNKNIPAIEEHRKWFIQKINSRNCLYFIVNRMGKPIGSARIDLLNNKETSIGLISYLLDSHYHGIGLGKEVLRKLIEKARTENLVEVLVGKVFSSNLSSLKIFRSLGFEEVEEAENVSRFELKL